VKRESATGCLAVARAGGHPPQPSASPARKAGSTSETAPRARRQFVLRSAVSGCGVNRTSATGSPRRVSGWRTSAAIFSVTSSERRVVGQFDLRTVVSEQTLV
jgi:hypothetical protein